MTITSGGLMAALDADASLRVFRTLLDTLANPGRLHAIEQRAPGGLPAVALPALSLADLEVAVSVIGDFDSASPNVATAIRRSTGARIVSDLADADMVVAVRVPALADIEQIRRGSATAPERGARLCLSCERLTADVASVADVDDRVVRVWVSGPGAMRGRLFGVAGIPGEIFETLAAVNRGHPAGVDTWIVADDGVIVGIPRSCRIEVVAR